jgi:hypothetical protein
VSDGGGVDSSFTFVLRGCEEGLGHAQFSGFAVQAQRLPADLAHQEHRLSRWFVQRQGQLVPGPGGLQGPPHLDLRPKEAVGRHGVVDALVGAEVVVVVDEVTQALLGLVQLLRLGPAPELRAHRPPEALALAQGLGVVRPGHHVLDALLHQQLLELALAPPGEILPALVREQLLGLAEALHALKQGLLHEHAGLLHPRVSA